MSRLKEIQDGYEKFTWIKMKVAVKELLDMVGSSNLAAEIFQSDCEKKDKRIAELESQLAHKEELRQEALGCLKNATSRADKLEALNRNLQESLDGANLDIEALQAQLAALQVKLTNTEWHLANEANLHAEAAAQLDDLKFRLKCSRSEVASYSERAEKAEQLFADINTNW